MVHHQNSIFKLMGMHGLLKKIFMHQSAHNYYLFDITYNKILAHFHIQFNYFNKRNLNICQFTKNQNPAVLESEY